MVDQQTINPNVLGDITIRRDNPSDIDDVIIEHLGDMVYHCVAFHRDGTEAIIDVPVINEKPERLSIKEWASRHTWVEILTASKVYFDLYNFVDGSPHHLDMYEAFEYARKSYYNPEEDIIRLDSDGILKTYVGGEWIHITITPLVPNERNDL